MEKLIIYQAFPRIFTNTNDSCVPSGTYEQNGSGKLRDLTLKLLRSLKSMGVNTIWLTGIIEMATKTAFDDGRIPADNPNVVKGEAPDPGRPSDHPPGEGAAGGPDPGLLWRPEIRAHLYIPRAPRYI